MAPPKFVANFDSATAMALATARVLRGEDFAALGQPTAMKPFAKRANLLPRRAREKVYIASGALETVSPKRVHKLDLEDISAWLADGYPSGPYPAVAVGASSGALVHLYAALRIPWLPQTFLIPVRQRVHPDNPTRAMKLGKEPGRRLVEAFPDIQLHHMHDANQDRLMVRALTYFRVKRRTLGAGYERFLRERLQPGGTILVIDCRRRWRTTRIGERHVFQHGALGGATEEEFHRGSERVAEYLERYGSPVRRWEGPEPDTESPEAEWGFEPALLDDIERFARAHGYRVRRLAFDEPEDPSPLVADLYRWWYRRRRIPANRLLVSSFIVHEPYWTLRTGSVPFWMKFNMEPSLEVLERYLDGADPFDEIHLALFQHGVEAVGLPRKERWAEVARARPAQGHDPRRRSRRVPARLSPLRPLRRGDPRPHRRALPDPRPAAAQRPRPLPRRARGRLPGRRRGSRAGARLAAHSGAPGGGARRPGGGRGHRCVDWPAAPLAGAGASGGAVPPRRWSAR